MNETGSNDVFAEINELEIENREATCQHVRKCIYYVLYIEGMLRKVTGIELVECSELVESDHRECLTTADFSECFAEEFVDRDKRKNRSINLNRKSHREKITEKSDQMLDSINVEKELHELNYNFSRAKIEQLDVDTTHVLRKLRKHVEGRIIRIEKSVEKSKLRTIAAFWRLMLSEKEGENVETQNAKTF